MKRIIFALLLLAMLPISVFAVDFYAGANAYYASLIQPADIRAIDTVSLDLADFAFGGEARLFWGLIWGSVAFTYSPGDANLPHRIDFLLDSGVGLTIGIVRAGIGIGPTYGMEIGNNMGHFVKTGANLRLTGDVLLGKFSLGLSWISKVEFTRNSFIEAFNNPYGQLGLAVLYKFQA
ncbi:MAG: hypothetical protein WBH97_06735 [Rectinemataceae bacterium]